MQSIINWFNKNRIGGTILEKVGAVHGIGLTNDRIIVQIFKKRIKPEKPVVRLGMKIGGFGDVYAKNTDLTSGEAKKLITLLQYAVKCVDEKSI